MLENDSQMRCRVSPPGPPTTRGGVRSLCEHVFVRWESQTTKRVADGRLPGLETGGVIRTFDAPEAMGVRFHEVEAKSAINGVPGEALPFNWTVNPYRGCSHACSYCLGGETPVLMADGSHRPLGSLQQGDAIVGTELVGRRRRFVTTSVLDHWETRKPAFRISLRDGTQLVASGDHRFLSERGWRFVASGLSAMHRMVLGLHLAGPSSDRTTEVAVVRVNQERGDLALAELERPALIGQQVIAPARLQIVAIEALSGVTDLFDITTGTGDFIADGVVSHNCFARPTHKYLDLNAREDFEREIIVKVNVPERLRADLAKPSWKGETIALGTNTDPYQWVEGRYELTRAIWEVMIEARNPGSVLTKSPLLTRDIDLMKELHEVAGFQASLSIPTLDEKAWRATEPRTPHPRKRIEAVAALSAAGIPVGVLVAPLMPGINDAAEQVEEILRLCAEAGADSVGGLGLHLKGEVREIFMDWLRGHRPDLVDEYERLYRRGAFLPKPERERIGRLIGRARDKAGVGDTGWRDGIRRNRERARIERIDRRGGVKSGEALAEPVPQRQPRLF